MEQLLTRDEFRNGVFARDNHCCVICGKNGPLDAHHIMERRLFDSSNQLGGYFLSNGASLCDEHHIQAEQTVLSCEQIREAAGIETIILPEHLYNDEKYDKWGNILRPDGTRLKGELFYDESVQKVIAGVLDRFCKYIKYPRTFHLPWSPGTTPDDRVLSSVEHFEGQEVVVTVKEDGECTSMYPDHIHARSIDSGNHPSRNWVKNLHGKIGWQIPEHWRICGENLFAKHSIKYENLLTYFMVFSIWNEKNECLSWDDTLEWCDLFELEHVPVLYRGIWDTNIIKNLYKPTHQNDPCEGYVVRLAKSFSYGHFRKSMAKYVRQGHVVTHGHWMHSAIEQNKIKIR